MADMSHSPQPESTVDTPITTTKPKPPPRIPLNQLYALPAPLRTFPLPTLVPHNPISLFHLLYVWISQAISPTPSNFDPLYQGWWSPDTRSVHVTDNRSIRGLWEQGFYGKGSLSRSEPNWLNREKTRRGAKSRVTSEEITQQRREERQQTKWERARKAREVIDRRLFEETEQALQPVSTIKVDSTAIVEDLVNHNNTNLDLHEEGPRAVNELRTILSPVGPLELLLLPNSSSDLERCLQKKIVDLKNTYVDAERDGWFYPPPTGPMQLLALPNSLDEHLLSLTPKGSKDDVVVAQSKSNINGHAVAANDTNLHYELDTKTNGDVIVSGNDLGVNGHTSPTGEYDGTDMSDKIVGGAIDYADSVPTVSFTSHGSDPAIANDSNGSPKIKRQKSVRFSPTVEKNTFIISEPPSPERAVTNVTLVEVEQDHIKNEEHFQLTMEEAFFLSYSLGALTVFDPVTNCPMTNESLFDLFRKSSLYPPAVNPSLSPDDPFMLNYVVYHHYRSLGWCVRGGAKFSCDFMLYNKGPVFSHAEFAVIILPSYTDEYWSSDVFLQKYAKGREHRTWAWMHCINRVITQVKKSLVLVYVDIPRPISTAAEKELSVDGMLQRYQVREFIMKRWQMNREHGNTKRKG